MIIDSLTNLGKYINFLPDIATVQQQLASEDICKAEPGPHSTENPNVRYMINAYQTHDKGTKGYETHRREADVQIILSGHETIDIAAADSLKERGPYNKENDIQFFSGTLQTSYHASAGTFAIFLPGEAHEPNLTDDTPDTIRKAVFKIVVD